MKRDDLCGAIRMACDAHWGQTDKNGEPYILHPLRVMMQMETEFEKVCAVLHDVLEDGTFSSSDFYQAEDIYKILELLTHKNSDPYMDYIKRLAENPVARKIKIADISDNMSPERMGKLDQETRDRLFYKYYMAIQYLLLHNGEER